MKPRVDQVPHPGQRLLLAPRIEFTAGAALLMELLDVRPEFFDALILQRADLHHLRVPVIGAVLCVAAQAEQAQRARDLRFGARRGGGVNVGLVDDDEIGELHHALLDRLQIVAGVG